MIYMPVDHLEQIVVAGKFWKDWVASRPVETCCLDVTPLL